MEPRSLWRAFPPGVCFVVLTGFLGLTLLLYRPCLDGPPISDDYAYLLNPWVVSPQPRDLASVLSPTSQATRTLHNYAPVRALLHALEWRLFPKDAPAYHTTNLMAHAVASTLLVAFLVDLGVAVVPAALAGGIFLLHPANVEAVAWMNQLWSPVALAFVLLALLALPRRPGWATAAFVLALGSKPLAVCALPTAAALEWCRSGSVGDAPRAGGGGRWRWLALWTLLCVAFSVAQVRAAAGSGPLDPLYPNLAVAIRAIAVFAARYLVMATTSIGVAAFQEPPLPLSPWDPWWLASLAVLSLLAWRWWSRLRARDPEAIGWTWTVAAYAPVAQVFPFLYPMADRYLYFLLPGLLIATTLGFQQSLARIGDAERRGSAARLAAALALGLALFFGWRTAGRVPLWRSEEALLHDSAARFPDGVSAQLLRSRRAAEAGDVEGAIAPLREAAGRGWDYYDSLLSHPAYARVRTDPRFQAFVRELAGRSIERSRRVTWLTQLDWMQLADAHALRGETRAALDSLEKGLAIGGPLDPQLRARRDRLQSSVPSPAPDAALPGEGHSGQGSSSSRRDRTLAP